MYHLFSKKSKLILMHIDSPFSFDNFSFVGDFGVCWELKDPERLQRGDGFKKQIFLSYTSVSTL